MNDFNSDFPLYWSPLLPKLPVISGWTSRKIGLESMGQKLGVSGPIFRMNQVHGDTIVEVSPESPRVIDGADALITRHKGLALVVKTADCVPLMIGTIRVGAQLSILAGGALNLKLREKYSGY